MMKADVCPKCSCMPTFQYVGDNKDLVVLQCPYCGYIAANMGEAKSTKRAAIKVWNRHRPFVN